MRLNRMISGLLLAAWLLAACSPAATTAAPTSIPPATAAATTAATAAATTSGAVTEVQFWHVYSAGSAQGTSMDALIAEFNAANPDVKVVGTYQGSYPDISKKITAAIAGNALPDLAVSYQNDIANYVLSGAKIQPLDAWLTDPTLGFSAADMADIYPSYIDHYPGSNNQVLSIAYNRSMEVMFYNADMLAAAGFDKPPASWDDFMAACAKVSQPPNQYCYAIGADASRFANWVWSRGGELLAPDGKSVAFQDQGLASLQFLNTLVQKNYAYLIAKQFGDQSDFGVGKAAFTFGSSAGIPFYATAVLSSTKPFNWSVAPVPHTTPSPVVDVYGPSVAIFNNSPAKAQAAWRFVKFLMSPEANAKWVQATSYFPARKSTLDQLTAFMGKNPLYAGLVAALPYGKVEPQIAAWTPVRGVLADAITAVASGASTPEDAINTAVQKANALLAK
jgi:multiple sugar transport system substrate-binding protein